MVVRIIKKVLSWLLFLGLFILATQTCPSKATHEKKVTAAIQQEVKRQVLLSASGDGGTPFPWIWEKVASVAAKLTASYAKKRFAVDDFWIFSVGSVSDTEGFHLMSFGIFNHVFVFPMYVDRIARVIISDIEKT